MRRRELSHKRQKTNFAEPLVSKSWLRRADKNFTDFAKNRVFQQYQPNPTDAANRTDGCFSWISYLCHERSMHSFFHDVMMPIEPCTFLRSSCLILLINHERACLSHVIALQFPKIGDSDGPAQLYCRREGAFCRKRQ